MPELPEVETTARGLRARIVGRRIEGVSHIDWPRMLPNCSPERPPALLTGCAIAAVERRGKYLLILLDEGLCVVVHRKMSGNLLLTEPGVSAQLHTHFALTFTDGTGLHFVDPRKFGRVYIFGSPEEMHAYLDERLGPEPLENLTARALQQKLLGRRARLKSLLLDQRFLAGMGNLYADEALWEARLHPFREASSLTRPEVARLAEAIRKVLAQGIERRGSSFSTYRDELGAVGDNQNYLRAYGRGPQQGRPGRACDRCGSAFQRVLLGQRGTHICPRCQRLKPRKSRAVRS